VLERFGKFCAAKTLDSVYLMIPLDTIEDKVGRVNKMDATGVVTKARSRQAHHTDDHLKFLDHHCGSGFRLGHFLIIIWERPPPGPKGFEGQQAADFMIDLSVP
jgi:hypothetical protein